MQRCVGIVVCAVLIAFLVHVCTEATAYRVADAYYGLGGRPVLLNPRSLVATYFRKRTCLRDLDCMSSLVPRYSHDDAVVHLRIGDIFVDVDKVVDLETFAPLDPRRRRFSRNVYHNWLTHKLLKKDFTSWIVPLAFYERAASMLQKHGVRRIVIVCGTHKKCDMTNSFKYISAVRRVFARRGINTAVRFSTSPSWQRADNDIAYTANAPLFVPSKGNFSRLISELVRHRGGTALDAPA